MKHISNFNDKGELHGYQQYILDGNLWFRGCAKNGLEIGYEEENFEPNQGIGDKGTLVNFYIR